ncbi:tetratricopeptide repeat protein [Succinimonas amylolytica]|uniref:tetratricopeptide repeat protein n=1 Tax=Succinimonas amylolytica TaxID=83769 RepID=UPI0023A7E916
MLEQNFLDKDELQKLFNIAFVGCSRGFVPEARTVFSKILEAVPDHRAARAGLAFTHIVVDDFAPADEILQGLLAEDPDDDDSRGFLVLSKFLQKDSDAVDVAMREFRSLDSAGYRLASSLSEVTR